MIHNNIKYYRQWSPRLAADWCPAGLNGLAIGGKRRITIHPKHPKLVCERDGAENANPNAVCNLVQRSGKDGENVSVRKEPLIVEATLTASCISVFRGSRHDDEIGYRNSEIPQRDPSDPIWRFYYALPSHP